MIPSHVTTARCSGACAGHVGQECRPVRSKVAEVEVMVVRTAFSTGMLDTACRWSNIFSGVQIFPRG